MISQIAILKLQCNLEFPAVNALDRDFLAASFVDFIESIGNPDDVAGVRDELV